MKTPRVNDFDPDAAVPALGSPLDGMPANELPRSKLRGIGSDFSTPPLHQSALLCVQALILLGVPVLLDLAVDHGLAPVPTDRVDAIAA